jgi:hypothetical protein
LVLVLAMVCSGCGAAPWSLMKDKSPLAGQVRLPAFPDPVPPPITTGALPAGVVIDAGSNELVEAHKRLTGALEAAGFEKWSVYAFRDGFALITSWERIEEDGSPGRDRFRTRHPKKIESGFNFDEHAQLLFYAADGTYRLFVFTVSGTDPAKTAQVPIDGDSVGAGALPEELAKHPSADRVAEAHVYVFQKQGESKAEAVASSPVDAATHLTSAGIFTAAQLGVNGR